MDRYHFHDTGKSSPFTKESHIVNDTYFCMRKEEIWQPFCMESERKSPLFTNGLYESFRVLLPTSVISISM